MDKLLDSVDRWKKTHAPWAASAEGWEVLMWLLRRKGDAAPLKSLYVGNSFSRPTLRAALRQFVAAGVVEFVPSDGDRRRQIARTTVVFNVVMAQLGMMTNLAPANSGPVVPPPDFPGAPPPDPGPMPTRH